MQLISQLPLIIRFDSNATCALGPDIPLHPLTTVDVFLPMMCNVRMMSQRARWVTTARQCVSMFVLVEHPWLSTYFHHPKDMYTSSQRLAVMFTLFFSVLVANAMFFGQTAKNFAATISISIYSSLVTVPVGIIFPKLFFKAAHLLRDAESHSELMSVVVGRALRTQARITAQRILIGAWAFLVCWVAGAILICLVYGMQMDLEPVPPGAMPVSHSWLLAVFISLAQDFFLNGPFVCAVKTYVLCFLANYSVWRQKLSVNDNPDPVMVPSRDQSGTARVQATFMIEGPVGACLNPILRALCTCVVGEADEDPDLFWARVRALESRIVHARIPLELREMGMFEDTIESDELMAFLMNHLFWLNNIRTATEVPVATFIRSKMVPLPQAYAIIQCVLYGVDAETTMPPAELRFLHTVWTNLVSDRPSPDVQFDLFSSVNLPQLRSAPQSIATVHDPFDVVAISRASASTVASVRVALACATRLDRMRFHRGLVHALLMRDMTRVLGVSPAQIHVERMADHGAQTYVIVRLRLPRDILPRLPFQAFLPRAQIQQLTESAPAAGPAAPISSLTRRDTSLARLVLTLSTPTPTAVTDETDGIPIVPPAEMLATLCDSSAVARVQQGTFTVAVSRIHVLPLFAPQTVPAVQHAWGVVWQAFHAQVDAGTTSMGSLRTLAARLKQRSILRMNSTVTDAQGLPPATLYRQPTQSVSSPPRVIEMTRQTSTRSLSPPAALLTSSNSRSLLHPPASSGSVRALTVNPLFVHSDRNVSLDATNLPPVIRTAPDLDASRDRPATGSNGPIGSSDPASGLVSRVVRNPNRLAKLRALAVADRAVSTPPAPPTSP
jgi:hypothetical protein